MINSELSQHTSLRSFLFVARSIFFLGLLIRHVFFTLSFLRMFISLKVHVENVHGKLETGTLTRPLHVPQDIPKVVMVVVIAAGKHSNVQLSPVSEPSVTNSKTEHN